jgi:hypothetical protein
MVVLDDNYEIFAAYAVSVRLVIARLVRHNHPWSESRCWTRRFANPLRALVDGEIAAYSMPGAMIIVFADFP